MELKYPEALKIVGGLSAPSKMPGYGWSISALDCITGSKLRQIEGSVCSSCYALKGRYVFNNVKAAHGRRKLALQDPRFVDAFVVVLHHLHVVKKLDNRFRWFDAGDLQSVDHLNIINQIATRTPFTRHWLPTREANIVATFRAKKRLAPNLTVRLSMPLIGKDHPNPEKSKLPYSTVDVDGPHLHQCPAPQQNNECRSCDACWTSKNINYHGH